MRRRDRYVVMNGPWIQLVDFTYGRLEDVHARGWQVWCGSRSAARYRARVVRGSPAHVVRVVS